MAFSAHRERDARRLRPGDSLFLYTTRGCFRNPTRDRGRIAAIAHVVASARKLREPVVFGDRSFVWECPIAVEGLAPRGEGAELSRMVTRLDAFPTPSAWAATLRTSLLPLTERDSEILTTEVQPHLLPLAKARPTYAPTLRERVRAG